NDSDVASPTVKVSVADHRLVAAQRLIRRRILLPGLGACGRWQRLVGPVVLGIPSCLAPGIPAPGGVIWIARRVKPGHAPQLMDEAPHRMPQLHLCITPIKRRRPPRSGSLYIPAFHLAHGDGRHQAIAEVGRRLTHYAASKHIVSLHLSTGKRRVRADEAGAELDRTAISDSVLRPAPDQNQKTDRR